MSRIEDLIRSELHKDAARFQPSPDLEVKIDEAVDRREHRTRIAVVGSTAALTFVLVLGLVALVVLPGRETGESTRIASQSSSTTTSTAPSVAMDVTPQAPAPTPTAPPPSAGGTEEDALVGGPQVSPSAPTPATVPGLPTLTMTPPDDADTCTASWTADHGGSPIEQYWVTSESPPRPPSTTDIDTDTAIDTEVSTAVQATQTPDTSASFPLDFSVRVSASNAIGTGPTTEAVICGG